MSRNTCTYIFLLALGGSCQLGKINGKGYSAFPLKVFFSKKGFAKIIIGIGRGKKLYDKRESIKKRDENRRAQRGEE